MVSTNIDKIGVYEGFTNLFFLLFFLLILILFLYFFYKQMKNFFKEDMKEKKEDKETETFINLAYLNDFLFNIDDDGNLFGNEDNENKEIENEVNHPKNNETKVREEDNEYFKKNIGEYLKKEDILLSENENENQNQNQNQKESILYIVDKNSNNKNLNFSILNQNKLKYLECKGLFDEHIILNINDVKNREITKIINKIYNKYTFIYQTKDDDEPINYYIEYRPSQEKFIKLYNQNEDKVFYLEKIFYKEDNNNRDLVPLYKIYHYANDIGTIYSNLSNGENKYYKLIINEENNKNIISFSFILYLSFIKEELE